jgi:predicted ferric reductase
MNSHQTQSYPPALLFKPLATILLVGLLFAGMLAAITVGQSVGSASLAQTLQSAFGTSSVQLWWYITRAAGLTGYLLVWLSMIWGFAVSTKLLQRVLDNTFAYDFHEHLSLLGLGFIALHVIVLLFDRYLPFSLLQILVPFTDSYRPLWVGLGIIGFYILLLVTFTFYLRQRIGVRAFRSIHVLSLVGYLGTTLHGLFAGTDSALPVTMVLYAGTLLIVIFLSVYWLVIRLVNRQDAQSEVTHIAIRKPYRHG